MVNCKYNHVSFKKFCSAIVKCRWVGQYVTFWFQTAVFFGEGAYFCLHKWKGQTTSNNGERIDGGWRFMLEAGVPKLWNLNKNQGKQSDKVLLYNTMILIKYIFELPQQSSFIISIILFSDILYRIFKNLHYQIGIFNYFWKINFCCI